MFDLTPDDIADRSRRARRNRHRWFRPNSHSSEGGVNKPAVAQLTDAEAESGADAAAHVREALKALQSPQAVRMLLAEVLAMPLRQVDSCRRLGVAGHIVSDALRLIDMDERKAS